jgi:leishmanolysin-like peptidase
LCPNSISTKRQEVEILLSTVKHEILHALGFSVSLYAFYRDSKGEPLTERRSDTGKPPLNEKLQTYQWSDRVIKTFVRKNWLVKAGVMKREVNMIVTKNVVREVRDYFNCEDLEGAELEDQGEEGTALTHWEKRVFEVEVLKVM